MPVDMNPNAIQDAVGRSPDPNMNHGVDMNPNVDMNGKPFHVKQDMKRDDPRHGHGLDSKTQI